MNRTITAPAILLRAEGAILLAASLLLYYQIGASWLLFVLLLFAPDLSMLGYLAGKPAGAAIYNLAHTYAEPATLALYGVLGGSALALALGLIWLAHIGMDRLLGYGLKYTTDFKDTHLGRV